MCWGKYDGYESLFLLGSAFSPQWSTSSRPLYGLVLAERVIKSKKAYVARLSPDGQVLAVAMNQKFAAHSRMMFYSPTRSAVAVLADLKGCGANTRGQNQPTGRFVKFVLGVKF